MLLFTALHFIYFAFQSFSHWKCICLSACLDILFIFYLLLMASHFLQLLMVICVWQYVCFSLYLHIWSLGCYVCYMVWLTIKFTLTFWLWPTWALNWGGAEAVGCSRGLLSPQQRCLSNNQPEQRGPETSPSRGECGNQDSLGPGPG